MIIAAVSYLGHPPSVQRPPMIKVQPSVTHCCVRLGQVLVLSPDTQACDVLLFSTTSNDALTRAYQPVLAMQPPPPPPPPGSYPPPLASTTVKKVYNIQSSPLHLNLLQIRTQITVSCAAFHHTSKTSPSPQHHPGCTTPYTYPSLLLILIDRHCPNTPCQTPGT